MNFFPLFIQRDGNVCLLRDRYYVGYNPNLTSLFIFIQIKFIYSYACVMFIMKSMSICIKLVSFDEIIIHRLLVIKHIF